LISRGITQEAETTEHHLFAWQPSMYCHSAISIDVDRDCIMSADPIWLVLHQDSALALSSKISVLCIC